MQVADCNCKQRLRSSAREHLDTGLERSDGGVWVLQNGWGAPVRRGLERKRIGWWMQRTMMEAELADRSN